MKTDLSQYNNSWYNPGGTALKRLTWYFMNIWFIKCHWMPLSSIKCKILRLYGAQIGKGVVIKPGVSVKYPWRLKVGNYTWIGEDVWIDNLGDVRIGPNCCISQGAMLLCGNHNYKLSSFDLMVGSITLEDGVWIGAKSIVCPGVTAHSHSVLAVASVASSDLEEYTINRGNPAIQIKMRTINDCF